MSKLAVWGYLLEVRRSAASLIKTAFVGFTQQVISGEVEGSGMSRDDLWSV